MNKVYPVINIINSQTSQNIKIPKNIKYLVTNLL